jgi:hypothetical protein
MLMTGAARSRIRGTLFTDPGWTAASAFGVRAETFVLIDDDSIIHCIRTCAGRDRDGDMPTISTVGIARKLRGALREEGGG